MSINKSLCYRLLAAVMVIGGSSALTSCEGTWDVPVTLFEEAAEFVRQKPLTLAWLTYRTLPRVMPFLSK